MIVGSNILAGASGQAGYFLNRSVRLRSSASAYFNETNAINGNLTTWTWSSWIKRGNLSAINGLFGAGNSGGVNVTYCDFNSSSQLQFININSSLNTNLVTTQVFRDPSAWYHIVIAVDTTQATASNRVKIYVNGIQVTAFTTATYPAQNVGMWWTYANGSLSQFIGTNTANFFDGYLTEIYTIDGQALTPTSFGEFNTLTGVWQPKKYGGTYGTNGFYLNFNDNSAATAAAIGKDSSGNGNNWTPNNISVTAGVTYDSMTDVPTLTSTTTANYPVMNPLFGTVGTLSNANLSITSSGAGNTQRLSTMAVSSGKWYYEVTFSSLPTNTDPLVGFTEINNTSAVTQYPGQAANSYAIYTFTGFTFIQKVNNNTFANTNTTIVAQGNIIGVALDLDNNKIWFAKNNVWIDSGDPAAGTNSQFTVSAGTYAPCIRSSGSGGTATLDANFGQRPFSYTPPTGFVALNTYNLPTPTISNGANEFAATLYTGNGSNPRNITNGGDNSIGVTFQPDFVWIKSRNAGVSHSLNDSVRGFGTTKNLQSNTTGAEGAGGANGAVNAALSNGFTVVAGATDSANVNNNTVTYVGWQWKASNAAAVTNTSGSISSQVSANPSAGFSIVTYTGTGANGATVGHGLGVAPRFIIVKGRSAVVSWQVYHASLTANGGVYLDSTNAYGASAVFWNNTAPTSSVFSLGTATQCNGNGTTYVAYCFSEIAGYSKFGSYTGNGSADGVFVYTGFRPRFVMIKGSSFVSNWFIEDSARNGYNVNNGVALRPNLSSAEDGTTTYNLDILSNGFKLRSSAADSNTNGATFIFAAFAESPFKNALAR
jgi:hypothetical protein